MASLDDLPERHRSHDTEHAAEIAFSAAIASGSFFHIQANDRNDYGTDVQLEARDGDRMTNLRVHVQLKGTEAKANANGSVSVTVSRTNLTPSRSRFGLILPKPGRPPPRMRVPKEAFQAGVKITDLYLQVFQRCQREIGRLWQLNHVTVAQEHYCTAATQLVMAQFYPYLFSRPKDGRRLVATSVAGELHEVGLRIVTDLFEANGWNTAYFGANVPAKPRSHHRSAPSRPAGNHRDNGLPFASGRGTDRTGPLLEWRPFREDHGGRVSV